MLIAAVWQGCLQRHHNLNFLHHTIMIELNMCHYCGAELLTLGDDLCK